jgi:hypothetical protein
MFYLGVTFWATEIYQNTKISTCFARTDMLPTESDNKMCHKNLISVPQKYTCTLQGFLENSDLVTGTLYILRVSRWMVWTDLSFCGKGKPSRRHVIWGVGLPVAMHFSDTGGPGCMVWWINLYRSCGWAAATKTYLFNSQNMKINLNYI